MGTPLGPKYIPYSYMDPLGMTPISDVSPIGGDPHRMPSRECV